MLQQMINCSWKFEFHSLVKQFLYFTFLLAEMVGEDSEKKSNDERAW